MRAAGTGLALLLGMTLCSYVNILGTTHTNFMKMQLGIRIRVRLCAHQGSFGAAQNSASRLLCECHHVYVGLVVPAMSLERTDPMRVRHSTRQRKSNECLALWSLILAAMFAGLRLAYGQSSTYRNPHPNPTLTLTRTLTLMHTVQVQLMDMVYSKALRLSTVNVAARGAGGIVNLQTNDVNKLERFPVYMHGIWEGPLQVCFSYALQHHHGLHVDSIYATLAPLRGTQSFSSCAS